MKSYDIKVYQVRFAVQFPTEKWDERKKAAKVKYSVSVSTHVVRDVEKTEQWVLDGLNESGRLNGILPRIPFFKVESVICERDAVTYNIAFDIKATASFRAVRSVIRTATWGCLSCRVWME